MPDTTGLDPCWHDQREQDFNVEVHHLLDEAADAIDTSNEPGPKAPLAAIGRALAVVDRIRGRLIAEQEFRHGASAPDSDGLGKIVCDLAVGLDALGLLIRDHEANELGPTLELILDRFQSCKDRLDSAISEEAS
jgi:hypothetical protein